MKVGMDRKVLLAMLACIGFVAGAAPVSFDWRTHASGKAESFVPQGVPADGAYSVRFRAVLLDATGNRKFRVIADGVSFSSQGDGFDLSGTDDTHVAPGQLNDARFDFHLRNRCYHEFVFICLPDRIVFFGDGKENSPVLKAGAAPRGFRIVGEGVDVSVRDLEVASQDMTGVWTSRNMAVNGGLEDLVNGYPPYWSTQNFGFGSASQIANLEQTRAAYRVDGSTAWEGANSMYIASDIPFYECWRARPKGEFVFSVYAKAERAGTKLSLRALSYYQTITNCVVELSTEWRRYEMSFRSSSGSFRCGVARVEGTGGLWVDALQVERGRVATPFVPHRVPHCELPEELPKVMDCYYPEKTVPKKPGAHPPRMPSVDPKRNSFRVDGKEFFPYGLTGMIGTPDSPDWAKALDRLSDWGINCYSVNPGYQWTSGRPKTPEAMRRMLDECERHGIKTKLYIEYDRKTDRLDEEMLALVKSVAGHPNIVMVDLLDETYQFVKAERRRELCERVRRELGGRIPVAVNDFDLGVLMHMDFTMCDVASADVYLPGMSEISAQYYILKLLRDDNPDQVVFHYAMAGGHFATWSRDATPAEVIAQAYNGFVLEIFGILWWQAVPLTAPAGDAVAQVKRERDLIDPSAFLDGTPVGIACDSRNDAVKFTARRMKNGITRLIAINIENRPNTAKWTLPGPVKNVRPLVGKAPDKIDGVQIEDRFGPLERRVYDLAI